MNLRSKFVYFVYATHNQSTQITKAIKKVLKRLDVTEGSIGLNIGAGATNLHPSILNIDIVPELSVNCIAKAEQLPFANDSISVIITQETLEHVQRPFLAVKEMHRVLKRGGTLYVQLPFVIGYHPGPTDYWRFSREGIQELVEEAEFHCEEIDIAVGPATGFYRIIVEFIAVFVSRFFSALYYPTKGAAAIFFYPLKWLDPCPLCL